MEKNDIWLHPSEEAQFNIEARNFNERVSPLLHTDAYLSAFIHIHRRHNPLIPRWAAECTGSNLVDTVAEHWTNEGGSMDARFMAIGAARRLCSLPLRMDAGNPLGEDYIFRAQRRGLLYPIRENTSAFFLTNYNTADAQARLEGAEVLSILAYLIATFGHETPDFTDILPYRYEPYEPLPSQRLLAPERRLCASLARAAFHVRAVRIQSGSEVIGVRSPFGLLGEQDQSADVQSVPPFSKEDFHAQSHLSDGKNRLRVAVSTLAGKLSELHDLGVSEHYTYNSDYSCSLQRRSTALTLISPFILFLKTPFTQSDTPRGPSSYHYLSYGCKPTFINGVVDLGAFEFEKFFYKEVVAVASSYEGLPGDETWERIQRELDTRFLEAIATDPPAYPTISRPSPSNPTGLSDHRDPPGQAPIHNKTPSVPTLPTPQMFTTNPAASSVMSIPQSSTAIEFPPPSIEPEQHARSSPCEVFNLSDIIHSDILDHTPVTQRSPTPPSKIYIAPLIPHASDADISADQLVTLRMSDIEGSLHEALGNMGGDQSSGGDEMDIDEHQSMEIDDDSDGADVSHSRRPEIDESGDSTESCGEDRSGASEAPDSELDEAGKPSGEGLQALGNALHPAPKPGQCDVTANEPLLQLFLTSDSELSEPDEDQGNPTPVKHSAGSRGPMKKKKVGTKARRNIRKRILSPSGSSSNLPQKRPRHESPERSARPEEPLAFLRTLFLEHDEHRGRLLDVVDVDSLPAQSNASRKKKAPMETIEFRAQTTGWDAEMEEHTPVEGDFTFAYREKMVAKYFHKLLDCYSDAKRNGSATTMRIMGVAAFKSLAPADRGDVLREPILLEGSPVTTAPAAHTGDELAHIQRLHDLEMFPVSISDANRFIGKDSMLLDIWVDVGIAYYFSRWSSMHCNDAQNIRVEICQGSAFTSASIWYKVNMQLADPEGGVDLPIVQNRQLTTRKSLSRLKLSGVEYIILPYFLNGNHFALVVIKLPRNQNGEYVVFCFDSFQYTMETGLKHTLTLMLMESRHCDEVAPPSGAYDPKTVEEFQRTCIRFIQVKTTKQTGVISCGLFVVYYVRQLLAHWPPREEEFACDSPVPWMAADTNEVEKLRSQLPIWLVSNMKPSSLSGLPEALGFSGAGQIVRREYLNTYIEDTLQLDPNVVVEVQHLDEPRGACENLAEADDYERLMMSLSSVAEEISDTESGRRLNALSIPSNHLIGASDDIWRLVADDIPAQESFDISSGVTEGQGSRSFAHTKQEPRAFFILSSAGTTHPVHFDASGFSTLIAPLDGQKLFLIACPISDTEPTSPNLEDGDSFVLMKGPNVKVYLVALKPGNILIMPPRSYHAVATLDSKPAILQGAFFDSRFGMQRTVAALIECTVWHSHWTNVLYAQRFNILAFMLEWHARAPAHKPRFTNGNLYALLFAAIHSAYLVPCDFADVKALNNHQPKSWQNEPIHAFLLQTGTRILQLLPLDQQKEYDEVQHKFRQYMGSEYKRLYSVLESQEQ